MSRQTIIIITITIIDYQLDSESANWIITQLLTHHNNLNFIIITVSRENNKILANYIEEEEEE